MTSMRRPTARWNGNGQVMRVLDNGQRSPPQPAHFRTVLAVLEVARRKAMARSRVAQDYW